MVPVRGRADVFAATVNARLLMLFGVAGSVMKLPGLAALALHIQPCADMPTLTRNVPPSGPTVPFGVDAVNVHPAAASVIVKPIPAMVRLAVRGVAAEFGVAV